MPAHPVIRPERPVLHDFVTRYREDIITRAREKAVGRPVAADLPGGLESGVGLFLSQLSDTLRKEAEGTPAATRSIADAAARHGADLLSLGFTLSEVVHAYGDICQTVTELAVERDAPISTVEFHTLNRCLDTAIAEAVTEHARLTAQRRANGEVERLGQIGHEIRNHLSSALFAFDRLRRGMAAASGSTGAALGRSLFSLRDVVDSTLADIRMSALPERRERIRLAAFLSELAVAAAPHAEYRGLSFTLARISSELTIDVDPYLMGSAVNNLLSNAFKYTREGGHVVLAAAKEQGCVNISVADECGGIPETSSDPFQAFGDRRGDDRSGLGLGLSIARRAVRSHGGDITISNAPGIGCVFTIQLPIDATGAGGCGA